MTSTANLFELAQLAEASYALLEGTENNDVLLKSRLIAANGDKYNFSPAQATEFVLHWKVASVGCAKCFYLHTDNTKPRWANCVCATLQNHRFFHI